MLTGYYPLRFEPMLRWDIFVADRQHSFGPIKRRNVTALIGLLRSQPNNGDLAGGGGRRRACLGLKKDETVRELVPRRGTGQLNNCTVG